MMPARHAAAQAPPDAASFRRERLIRFSDCDPAGIVFYAEYFVMFNGLVEDWVNEELAIGYHTLVLERRIGLPTVHMEVDVPADLRAAIERWMASTRLATLATC